MDFSCIDYKIQRTLLKRNETLMRDFFIGVWKNRENSFKGEIRKTLVK
jgi:hypothetical protein